MDALSQNIISFTVFVPLLAGLVCFVAPSDAMARWVAFGGALLAFLGSAHVGWYFDPTTPAMQFVESRAWLPEFGIRYRVGVDGLSLLLIILTTFLTPLILISQWDGTGRRHRVFLGLMMSLETGMLGALVALDLVFFYIFWEAMLIPMYFLIGIWGGPRRIYATTKFVLYTVLGSLLMLAAAIVLYVMHYEQFGTYSTDLLDLYRLRVGGTRELWLFGAFALAFAIKVPVWPFHTWLPDAHVEAPTAGSVVLAGVLLKMGTYGLLRFAIPLFPEATTFFAPFVMGLGVIGIIYGALTAWAQQDMKKLVAYSSVSHLGFVVIGSVALVDDVLSVEALTGATYQMINHGISTGALFFLVGTIYERRHTRQLADFGGLAGVMPWFATYLIIATLGSVGLPGTGGFVGEFLILLGTFQAQPVAGILATTGVLLGAVYMLTLCRRVLFGPVTSDENKKLKDLTVREHLYLAPLAILVVVMGVWPEAFLGPARASIEHLARNYQRYQLTETGSHSVDRANAAPEARL